MTATNPITVRRMAFEFPSDLDPATLFGDPERSYIVAGLSMSLPYVEPYLIRTMKEAKKHVTDSRLLSDMERFNAQEGQHFKEHMRFNEVIRASFPGLSELEAELEADYQRFSKEEPLKWNLAYVEGFEALTAAVALSFVEAGMLDMHPAAADLLNWHLLEELEHRTVAFDVYEHVHGSDLYRLRVGTFAQGHLIRFIWRVCVHMMRAKPEIIEKAGGLKAIRASRAPEVNNQLRSVLKGWMRTLTPWYTPHKIPFTPKLQELAALYTSRAVGPARPNQGCTVSKFEQITLHANGLSFSALTAGRGPVVLCLHGFPDCMRSYRHQLPAFAAAGYRAIAPTMRGYEPSSQPANGDYHIVRMAEDVIRWLDELGEERVHLVGHDWGAVVSYVAAAMAPERFHSLTTIAIPHLGGMERRQAVRHVPKQIANSWYMVFFQLRGISDAIVSARNWAFIDKLWRDWSPGWNFPAEEIEAVKKTLAQPGVKSAALGYYRAYIDRSEGAKQTRRLFHTPIRVPTLALTGALDGCMDTRLYEHSMSAHEFHAGFRVERFDDAGHFLHQEQPERTNKLLIEWMKAHTQAEPAATPSGSMGR